MKNLKKVLALGLALVMVLGMFTIASAAEVTTATDLSDFDTVERKDAVALAVDLGIIKGMPDGSYSPAGNIDRASWAKMVYMAYTGDTTSEGMINDNSPLVDIAGTWAEGYINYIYSEGLVSGDQNGNFFPTSNVTVAEASKTMLTAVGYNADDRGYQNSTNWANNIMKDAKKFGVLDGVTQTNGSAALTRDNAAQMIFNILVNVGCVEAQVRNMGSLGSWVEGYKTNDDDEDIPVNLGSANFGITEQTGVVTGVDADGNATGTRTAADGELAASPELIGQTVRVFLKDGELLSTSLVPGDSKLVATKYDADMSVAFVEKDEDGKKNSGYVGEAADEVSYYLNGKSVGKEAAEAAIVDGVKVEFIDNAGEGIDTVKVTTYDVVKASADASSKTDKNGVTKVTVAGLSNIAVEKISGWEDVKEGDVVLVSKVAVANLYTLEKAESVTGKVTSAKADSITIGGTAWKDSAISVGGDKATVSGYKIDSDNKDDEYTLYLDKAGNVVWIKLVSESTSTSSDPVLALLTDTGVTGTSSGLGTSSATFQAELIFLSDASKQVVTVSQWNNKDPDADEGKYWAGELPMLVAAVETDDGWELGTDGVAATDPVTSTALKNQIQFLGDGVTTLTATTATKFFIEKVDEDEGNSYSVATGFAAIPTLADVTACQVTLTVDNEVVETYIALSNDGSLADEETEAKEVVYVLDAEDWELTAAGYTYSVIDGDGDTVNMVVTADAKGDVTTGLMQIETKNSDGAVTKFSDDIKAKTVKACGDGVITIDNVSFTYDSATKCIVIDIDDEREVTANTFVPGELDIDTEAEDAQYAVVVGYSAAKANEVADSVWVIRDVNEPTVQ